MIKTESVSKFFGSTRAVDDLNLDINSGEFYCLLGPNGAGKTTTLKLLSSLAKPTKGVIRLLGLDIQKDFASIKGKLGLIPDTPFLYENLTIQEFLEFIGVIFDIDKDTCKERVDHYLEIFNLNSKRFVLIRDLSHGMKQRVSYISNFIHKPRILLIDEPFVGLDPYSIKLLKDILKEYTRDGATILMSTHILDVAEELADRIGILDKGKLIAQGSLEELQKKVSLKKLEDIFLRLTQ